MHPKDLLARHNISPKKSLGQNFLFDENILRRIAGAAELEPEDNVLEIGPGLGALTHILAETAASVVAVELDNRLLPILRREMAPYPQVKLVHGDILDQNPGDWFDQSYKAVANVPYYITGAILRHLLGNQPRPTILVLTVQKEVAQRVTAVPPHMSLLAVSVQFYGQAHIVDTLKAGSFWPRPEVDSAILRVDLYPQLDDIDEKAFFRVVKAGFAQRRKQLQKNLRNLGHSREIIGQALEAAGIEGRRRAETCTIAEWKSLINALETIGHD